MTGVWNRLGRIACAALSAALSPAAGAADTTFANAAPNHEQVNSTVTTRQGTIGLGNFVGGAGIVTVNQAPGNVNNQGNLINLGLFEPVILIPAKGPAPASDGGDDANHAVIKGVNRQDAVSGDAFSSFSGVSAVNQITGNATGQTNVIGIALGAGPLAPLTPQALMAVSTNPANTTTLTNSTISDSVQGTALTGMSGVMAASQSGGDFNRNTNAIGISFNTMTLH